MPPTPQGHFFASLGSSRVSSLPVAAHAVQHQDNNAQAVAGSMWRAKDSAEHSCFVLPSGYLERGQKTKQVVGGVGVCAAPGASPAASGTCTICMALCEEQAEATDGT